ncbi:unnamed protein product [Fusarium venenatum]|uniref:Uncharacterized protein n=1 Tax=Fusarium venenatum TaxID=56646 RepID=A0A2L2TUS8_9HYPO|nr:uncharacterized protein FVRRES_01722 [Fusarium venenatum]CEI65210.1 unnamed protein product [Fusarium venenatum]
MVTPQNGTETVDSVRDSPTNQEVAQSRMSLGPSPASVS